MPEGYHFGGHTFVVCGYDGADTLLASDMDQRAAGLKAGFYAPITRDRLRAARSSPHKPFPPNNVWLEFDSAGYRTPSPEDLYGAIRQAVDALLNPPISNLGVKGIRRTAKELLTWPRLFDERALRMNLFNLYVYIEIGGTGGGCFRPMYARFLREAAVMAGDAALEPVAGQLQAAGARLTEIALLFEDAETANDLDQRIAQASQAFLALADQEEAAYRDLAAVLP
jgi:hypothetical protein